MVQAAQNEPEPAPAEGADGQGPYRNLWVPLVVVPFLVVGVIVLVFVFFGAIGGSEATIQENLQRVVHGGSNERKQAAMSLAAQVLENREAEEAGREPAWDVGPDILADVLHAWEALPADDNPSIRLALAELAAHYGDPDGLAKLAGFLEVPDADDPEGRLRAQAMLAISSLGDERAADLIAPFLQHSDPFLQQAAAAYLQVVPGEASLAALRPVLGSASLELRGQAAISLARLGDPAGAEVLRELVDPASYERAREAAPRKYASERFVHQSRLEAVRALARLARPQDRPLLEELAAGDPDTTVREAAMLALQGRVRPKAGRAEASDPAGGADQPDRP